MTTPSKPYATSAQVAMLVPALLKKSGGDFDGSTTPNKDSVDQYLTWISNQIDMQFQQAGYIVPFVELSGESWPVHQTYYLQLMCSLGAAALTGGYVLKPAPAVPRGRDGSTGNIYQDLYREELRKVWDSIDRSSNVRFRTMAYSGTPAEKSITEPIGPSLDYIDGVMNPEDFFRLEAYTDLRGSIEDHILNSGYINWTYYWTDFHNLFEGKDTGYSYADNTE